MHRWVSLQHGRWIPIQCYQPFDFIFHANSRNWASETRNNLRQYINYIWNASDIKRHDIKASRRYKFWQLGLTKATSALCWACGSISACFVVSCWIRSHSLPFPLRQNKMLRLTQVFRSLTFTGQLSHSHQSIKIALRCKCHTCKRWRQEEKYVTNILISHYSSVFSDQRAHDEDGTAISCASWCQSSWVMSSKKSYRSRWVCRTTGNTISCTGNTFRMSKDSPTVTMEI